MRVPHLPQNLKPGGISDPHDGHALPELISSSSALPHHRQRRILRRWAHQVKAKSASGRRRSTGPAEKNGPRPALLRNEGRPRTWQGPPAIRGAASGTWVRSSNRNEKAFRGRHPDQIRRRRTVFMTLSCFEYARSPSERPGKRPGKRFGKTRGDPGGSLRRPLINLSVGTTDVHDEPVRIGALTPERLGSAMAPS